MTPAPQLSSAPTKLAGALSAANRSATAIPPRHRRRRILGLVMLILILAGVTIYVRQVIIDNRQRDANRIEFTQLDRDMAAAFKSITAATGQPATQRVSRGCEYAGIKYEKRDLSCAINYYAIFSPSSRGDMIAKAETYTRLLPTHKFKTEGDNLNGVPLTQSSANYQLISKYSNSISCNTYMSDYKSITEDINIRLEGKSGTTANFQCRKFMKKPIYDIQE